MLKNSLRVGLLAVVGALALSAPASACPYQCSNLSASGIDSRVQIRFNTPIPMTATGSYVNTRPDFTGTAHYLVPATTTPTTSHVITTNAGLTPNTPYWYVIRLRDQAGRVYQDVINNAPFVTTLNRRFTVTMDAITMVDDSDSSGSGEITMHSRLGSTVWSYMWSNTQWDSGRTAWGPMNLTTVNGPQQIPFSVEAYDDDRTWGVAYGCGATQAPTWGNGSGSCGQWSTATQTVVPHRLAAGSGYLPTMRSSYRPTVEVRSRYNLSYYR